MTGMGRKRKEGDRGVCFREPPVKILVQGKESSKGEERKNAHSLRGSGKEGGAGSQGDCEASVLLATHQALAPGTV